MPGRTRQRRSYICAGRFLGIFDRRNKHSREWLTAVAEVRAREFAGSGARRS